MVKLKVKPSLWLVSYTRRFSKKREYLKIQAYNANDCVNRFYDNPNFDLCEIRGIEQLIDEILLPEVI